MACQALKRLDPAGLEGSTAATMTTVRMDKKLKSILLLFTVFYKILVFAAVAHRPMPALSSATIFEASGYW
jgi:hypothetical protein